VGRYVLVKHDGKETLVEEALLKEEAHLQEVFKCNPQLIPKDDLGLGDLLVVGREAALTSGLIDLLCVDQNGQVIIVEFKKGPENTEHRRVIAQLLDYGSYVWGMSFSDFERRTLEFLNGPRCSLADLKGCRSLREAYERYWGVADQSDEEKNQEWTLFMETLSSCLSSGEFYYLIISRKIDVITKRTVDYLSSLAAFRIAAVEIDHFEQADMEIFVPRTVLSQARRVGSSSPKVRTNESEFLDCMGDDARAAFEPLLAQLQGFEETIYWGTKGFSFRIRCRGKLESILWGYPIGNGQGILQFASDYYYKEHPDLGPLLRDYASKMKEAIPKVHATNTYYDAKVPEIVHKDNIIAVIDVVTQCVEALRAL